MNASSSPSTLEGPSRLNLRLNNLPWHHGLQWARDGARAFREQPLALMSLYTMIVFIYLVLAILPLLGQFLWLAMTPLVSLVFMIAVAQRERGLVTGVPTHPMMAVTTLIRQGGQRWKALGALCLAYALLLALVGLVALQLGDGWVDKAMDLLQKPRSSANMAEIRAIRDSSDFMLSLTVMGLGTTLVTLLFWHAAALIWWGHPSVPRALTFSVMALLRNVGAYGTYMVVTFGAAMILMTVVMFGASALGLTSMAGTLVTLVAVALLVWFYSTQWATFCDTFGVREAAGLTGAGDNITPVDSAQ
jgi:hypothetical protein